MRSVRFLFLICLIGCATWIPVGGPFISSDYAFEVELPSGWRRTNARDGLTLTRDGLSLQMVRIVREPFDKELAFTKRKIDKGMLPQELAEIVIDNIRSNREISNVQVSENQPATIGGYPGFRVAYSYHTKDNLKKQGVFYGVLVDQWFYRMLVEAPARHYFPRDLAIFEQIKQTFKITL